MSDAERLLLILCQISYNLVSVIRCRYNDISDAHVKRRKHLILIDISRFPQEFKNRQIQPAAPADLCRELFRDDSLQIAGNTQRLDDHKPPRIYWIEGNKMYFIMATAAVDWFEHIDNLVEIITGKKRLLINVMNDPIRLAEYKKKKRGANSGIIGQKSYFYKPDTAGIYYQYFWFHELRPKYREDAVHGVKIVVYIYGEEKKI